MIRKFELSQAGMNGGEFVHPVRVYYEDTDAAGLVYYANYLRFAERARTEMTRMLGLEQGKLGQERDLYFVVRRCHADYRAPARLDDLLEIATRITALGGASMEMAQVVRRHAIELVRLDVRLACINGAGRPVRIPEDVYHVFQGVVDASTRQG
ncbi:Acyl-CoA thioesterase YbgC [uncultured Defluviicoccus sp.]|uniref:Acyl-CoA thioesterase YbgC n=1 Tax=metagenome TaxID=256318 RepID=A0A380TFX1_9ZZZZ|nr:Acyl-CoA thioesterase YbgC [uncultured Defluviicoccus sp.]